MCDASRCLERANSIYICGSKLKMFETFFRSWSSANFSQYQKTAYPAGIYLFFGSNGKIEIMCKIYLKWTMKTLTRHQLRLFVVYIVKFEHILHIFLVLSLLTLNKIMSIALQNLVSIQLKYCSLKHSSLTTLDWKFSNLLPFISPFKLWTIFFA